MTLLVKLGAPFTRALYMCMKKIADVGNLSSAVLLVHVLP